MAQRQAMRAPRLLLPVAAILLLAACASAPQGTPTRPTGAPSGSTASPAGSSADPGALAAAKAILDAASLDEAGSLDALEGIRFTAAGTEAAGALIASGPSGDVLWAATYVYGSSTNDPAPLLAVATSATASATVKAMAGAALVGLGNAAGFEPLIATLGSSEAMEGSSPAGAIWEFSAGVLERYTQARLGPELSATDADRVAAQAAWEAWLTDHSTTMQFDSASQQWVTP